MITQTSKHLEQKIIQLLAKTPGGSSAAELHQLCNAEYRSCSIQGIYHELRKLQNSGVLIKQKDRYSLSLTWAFEMVGFADTIYDNYIASASHLQIIPENNSSLSWRFTNLLRLDDLWVQAMLALYNHTDAKQMYAWIPHPWFYFAQLDKVNQFYHKLKQEGWRYYSTINGETFLDKRYAESMDASFYECRIGEAPVFSDTSKHHTITGDYMITVSLDKDTEKRIEELFQSIHSLADATYERVSAALNVKGKLTLKIEHNPKKVGAYARKFKRYFGA